MKLLTIALAVAALSLGGCQRKGEEADAAHHGRYLGVGVYPAGSLWQKMVVANPSKQPASAKLLDDEQVVVVVDSNTGEIRQCGNLSGYCIALNPWASPAVPAAPVNLSIHADQLEAEQREADQRAAAKPVSTAP
jgi:hypothetical protein